MKNKPKPELKKEKRKQISQTDIPMYSLEESLRVAQVINDDYGGGATAPHRVAEALALSPTSSGWRMLSGSAIAYGLTEGGYAADTIKLTESGKKIVAPLDEGQDVALKIVESITYGGMSLWNQVYPSRPIVNGKGLAILVNVAGVRKVYGLSEKL